MSQTAFLVLVLALAALQPAPAAADPVIAGPAIAIDGDTVDVATADGTIRIRLYGLDTPERGEPGWAAARNALQDLSAPPDKGSGGIACTARPGERTWGRAVATCRNGDGADLALHLLLAGHAAPWCSYLRGDPLERPYLAASRAAWAAALFGGRQPPPAKRRHRC